MNEGFDSVISLLGSPKKIVTGGMIIDLLKGYEEYKPLPIKMQNPTKPYIVGIYSGIEVFVDPHTKHDDLFVYDFTDGKKINFVKISKPKIL